MIGQDHHRAKLTDHDVWLIHELKDNDMRYADIARKFEISLDTVKSICSGRKRGHAATGQKLLITKRCT